MIIVKRPWHAIPDGTLVVSPATGRIMTMLRKDAMPDGSPVVYLSDPEHDADGDFISRIVPVDPNAEIDMIETDSSLDRAVDILSRSFALKRM